MITTLFQQLPQLYANLLPDVFGKELHVEIYADCNDCNMCQPNDVVTDQRFFSSTSKCCTFKPIVPNYLIGGILKDSKKETKIHEYVKSGQKMSPLGYFPTQKELKDYASIIPHDFGIDDSVICELLDDGNCSIWQHRNSICSTYFCHYFKGIHGKLFWEDVRDFLQLIEETVAEYCCNKLDIPVDYLKHATTNFFINVQEAVQDAPMSTLSDVDKWGKWKGDLSNFFLECERIARTLTPKKLKALNPTKYSVKLAALEKSYTMMTHPTLPTTLKFNPKCKIIDFDDTQTFFYIDRLIKLPNVLKEITALFDGNRDSQSIIDQVSNDFNVEINQEYLIHLYEQKILIKA